MRRTIAVLLLALATFAGAVPAASAADPLPVPYQFLPSALLGGAPGANAPGTNDWTCKPSAAHPRPVVLVHGTMGNRATNWQTYGPLLKNNGYCVFALTYGVYGDSPASYAFGGMDAMQSSAQELAAFVARVRKATGAAKVDLIGHSQGTLMPQYYVRYLGGAASVHHYISLSPLWHGTAAGSPAGIIAPVFGLSPDEAVPICTACGQFAPTSRFLGLIRAGGTVATPGVRYTNIVTRYDQLVLPYTSGIEAGMTNIVLQDVCRNDFSEHFQIAASRNAARIVLNRLDPAHAQPVSCRLVLPFVGGL